MPRHQATSAAEFRGFREDGTVLAAKKQLENQILGDRPVSVLRTNTARDIRRMYEAGVAAGNGTQEERALYKEMADKWDENDRNNQQELLRFSSVAKYSYTATNCHNVQMTEPELVLDEIKCVLDHVLD
jgi:hypothetical protein